jgi:copper chaperone CopZ
MALFGKKEQATLDVQGMTCDNCRRHVEEALKGVPGVAAASVDLLFRRAKVSYDPDKATVEDMVRAVEEAGYAATKKETAA